MQKIWNINLENQTQEGNENIKNLINANTHILKRSAKLRFLKYIYSIKIYTYILLLIKKTWLLKISIFK